MSDDEGSDNKGTKRLRVDDDGSSSAVVNQPAAAPVIWVVTMLVHIGDRGKSETRIDDQCACPTEAIALASVREMKRKIISHYLDHWEIWDGTILEPMAKKAAAIHKERYRDILGIKTLTGAELDQRLNINQAAMEQNTADMDQAVAIASGNVLDDLFDLATNDEYVGHTHTIVLMPTRMRNAV